MPAFGAGAFETLHVAAGHLRPDHRPPKQIGALAHGVALGLVVQQVDHLLGQRRRITERHQRAAPVGQHLFRIPVRRRDHGLARPQGVGQSAGGDLRRVEIGRDVDIRRADELDEFLQADKAVVEDHVAFHAFLLGQPLQGQPVRFAFVLNDVGMGRAEDDVHDVRVAGHDGGQGGDDVLDAFVRREQAES